MTSPPVDKNSDLSEVGQSGALETAFALEPLTHKAFPKTLLGSLANYQAARQEPCLKFGYVVWRKRLSLKPEMIA